MNPKEYYLRKDVQKELTRISKNREVQAWFGKDIAGKRPEVVNYEGDIKDLIRQGMTSFHISEERWENPLDLESGMLKRDLDKLRIGWDLVLDLDSKNLEFSKYAGELLIEALKFHDVKTYSLKFSVTGDTPILIQLKDKKKLLSIKEAISLFKLGQKIKVLSLSDDMKLIFSDIYDSLEHKDKVYKLYYRQSGVPLTVTGNHSVFVWDNCKIIQKYVRDIKLGDYVVSYNSSQSLEFNNSNTNHSYLFKKNLINKPIKITKDLSRLIGYYLSEGHLADVNYMIGFSFDVVEREYIEDCKKLIRKIGKPEPAEYKPHPTSTQVIFYSKEWYSFFKNNCGKGSKNKHLPELVWDLPKDLFLELLRGYLRGDAHKTSLKYLTVKSVSVQLITEFLWLCKLHGISANLYSEKNKPRMLNGSLFKGSFVFMLKIPKRDLFIKEFNLKRKKFDRLSSDKVYPTKLLFEVYQRIKPGFFNKHRAEQMTLKKKMASAVRIKKVLDWFNDYSTLPISSEDKKIIVYYSLLINSDVALLPVRKIVVSLNEEMVYDVSVKDSERFFGGYYPILLHNSGNHGFHIAIPFEAFPKEVNGINIKDYFPDGVRVISGYLKEMIQPFLIEKILNYGKMDDIAASAGKKVEDIIINKKLDPFKVVDIDSILISSRHLFRAPYSLNEKSGLVSIPLKEVSDLDLEKAKPENVEVKLKFLDFEDVNPNEGRQLLLQAFDWVKKTDTTEAKKLKRPIIEMPKIAVKADFFPPCILKIMNGVPQDGRKRAIFILVNFLSNMGWDYETIEEFLLNWNKKNYEPLRDGYIKSQVMWAKKQGKKVLPPNCENPNYYKSMGVKCEEGICNSCRNPVNYTLRRLKINENQKRKRHGKI